MTPLDPSSVTGCTNKSRPEQNREVLYAGFCSLMNAKWYFIVVGSHSSAAIVTLNDIISSNMFWSAVGHMVAEKQAQHIDVLRADEANWAAATRHLLKHLQIHPSIRSASCNSSFTSSWVGYVNLFYSLLMNSWKNNKMKQLKGATDGSGVPLTLSMSTFSNWIHK